MPELVLISVVIPTCNREESLLRTLKSLDESEYPFHEIVVVDSSDSDHIQHQLLFLKTNVKYLRSAKSVCVQRNLGISTASGSWIFLCDDDIEVPSDYIKILVDHVVKHPEAGAVSGLVLQLEAGKWQEHYPVTSSLAMFWKSIFYLGVWGEIKTSRRFASVFEKNGNHISKAGWPVVTDFSGDYFLTPVYGLGASIVKKEWLVNSPYDEVLDRSGIGDNYGVAMGFPTEGIHVVNQAHVFHHRAIANRTNESVSYYRRLLALDYFISSGNCPTHVSRLAFRWSLVGNFLMLLKAAAIKKAFATAKVFWLSAVGRNPYVIGKRLNKKVIQPTL